MKKYLFQLLVFQTFLIIADSRKAENVIYFYLNVLSLPKTVTCWKINIIIIWNMYFFFLPQHFWREEQSLPSLNNGVSQR